MKKATLYPLRVGETIVLVLFFLLLIPFCTEAQHHISAVLNFSETKNMKSGINEYELSFVIKNFQEKKEKTAAIANEIMQNKNIFLQVFKDDVKPECVLFCKFTANDLKELNALFHEVLCSFGVNEIVLNKEKYSGCNSVLLQ